MTQQTNQYIEGFGKWLPVITMIFIVGGFWATTNLRLNTMQESDQEMKETIKVLDDRTIRIAQDVAVLKDRAGVTLNEKEDQKTSSRSLAGPVSTSQTRNTPSNTTINNRTEVRSSSETPKEETPDDQNQEDKTEAEKTIEKAQKEIEEISSGRIPIRLVP